MAMAHRLKTTAPQDLNHHLGCPASELLRGVILTLLFRFELLFRPCLAQLLGLCGLLTLRLPSFKKA